jgi:hypothetical protein
MFVDLVNMFTIFVKIVKVEIVFEIFADFVVDFGQCFGVYLMFGFANDFFSFHELKKRCLKNNCFFILWLYDIISIIQI